LYLFVCEANNHASSFKNGDCDNLGMDWDPGEPRRSTELPKAVPAAGVPFEDGSSNLLTPGGGYPGAGPWIIKQMSQEWF
jgi:hypothetical protein